MPAVDQPRFPTAGRRLVGIYSFYLRLRVRTGLLIRRPSKAQLSIGGADVWPMTIERVYDCGAARPGLIEVPYIPGSSIKGRMKSLLELSGGLRLVTTDGKIFAHVRSIAAFKRSTQDPASEFYRDVVDRCAVDDVFGYASFQYAQLLDQRELGLDEKRAREVLGVVAPTRLYLEDFYPARDYVCGEYARLQRPLYLSDFLEEKSENRIDRLTSAADPRSMVRVKPGVVFEGRLELLVFDNDLDSCPDGSVACVERNIELIGRGMRLLELLGLGAATSRGYGRVDVEITRIEYVKPMASAETVTENPMTVDELLERVKGIAAAAKP